MATKANPGQFDCYANAAPDEPLFVLRAKDPVAPALVRAWAYLRAGNPLGAFVAMENAHAAFEKSGRELLPLESDKSIEAQHCANAMEEWRKLNVK